MAPVALLALSTVLSFAHSGSSASRFVGLIAKEFFFDPNGVTVKSGEIAFVVKNRGTIEHNFVLEGPGGTIIAQIAVIEPGQTGEVKAIVPADTYTIYCSLPGHRDAGMVATLRVSP